MLCKVQIPQHLFLKEHISILVLHKPLLYTESSLWEKHAQVLKLLFRQVSRVSIVMHHYTRRSVTIAKDAHFPEHGSWDEGSDFLLKSSLIHDVDISVA